MPGGVVLDALAPKTVLKDEWDMLAAGTGGCERHSRLDCLSRSSWQNSRRDWWG